MQSEDVGHTRRLTVEEGIRAYRETGRVPRANNWGHCGQGVYAVAEGHEVLKREYCRETFGSDYVLGYTKGFDGAELDDDAPPRTLEGHEDGAALRRAVDPWIRAKTPLPAIDHTDLGGDVVCSPAYVAGN